MAKDYDEYGNGMMKPKAGGYMNPYAEGSTGAAMEACYNACQTCKYAMDHRMMLQCCHPKRAKTMAYDINSCRSMDEKYDDGFMLQEQSNYCVEPSWWCKNYEACGYENSPGMYGGGAVGGAAVGSAT